MMLTRDKLKLARRLRRTLLRRHLRKQMQEARVAQIHEGCYCWLCRNPLYHCSCPLEYMDRWYT